MEYFEMAIKMEVDGEKFYKEQANKNQIMLLIRFLLILLRKNKNMLDS